MSFLSWAVGFQFRSMICKEGEMSQTWPSHITPKRGISPCCVLEETGIIITATDVRNTKPHIDWQDRPRGSVTFGSRPIAPFESRCPVAPSFTSFFFSQADPYYAGFRVAVKVQRFDHSFTVNRQQDQQLRETWLWRNLFQSNIPCPIPHDFCISHQAEPTKPANICQSI